MRLPIKQLAVGALLFCACELYAQVQINEFMALNTETLRDEDQDFSDWIELKNVSTSTVNLDGWYLTDNADDLTKWEFPSTNILSGAFLVVFASDKDRSVSGSQLHTNFKLSGDGEYLTLVKPDGTTVVSEYAPEFPPQFEDVSYGVAGGMTNFTLIPDEAACTAFVPVDASTGTNWLSPTFNDSTWMHGTTGAGYDTGTEYQSLIHTDLKNEMYGSNCTAYLRVPFVMQGASNITTLTLHMKFDDGFAAYLNGVKVASSNAPDSLLWNSQAIREHSDSEAVLFVSFDLSTFAGALVEGTNILAIQALNNGSTSSDLLVLPQLECGQVTTVTGNDLCYLLTPTPGEKNSDGYLPETEPVVFSVPGGVFFGPVSVELFSTNSARKIVYTLDGSEPTETSAEYSGAIPLTSTTCLRARSYEPGLALGPINSEYYLFIDNSCKSFSSDLPVMVIDNLGAGIIPDSTLPDQTALVALFDPGTNGRTSLSITNFTLNARAGIHRRGDSSLRATDRKPNLAVETRAADSDDGLDIAPFGMPPESDWVLLAAYDWDKPGLRNALMYNLSNQTENYAVRTRFVEVFLNYSGGALTTNHYNGLYILMEKIKRDSNRVDVEKLTPQDNALPNIAGGYLLRKDRISDTSTLLSTSEGLYCIDPPKDELTTDQKNYITTYIRSFESQLFNSDPTTGYPKYIDVGSFIDHHLLNMLAQNVDGLRLSTYMRKSRYGKLTMGPLWDFDRSIDSTDSHDDNPEVWCVPYATGYVIPAYQLYWYTRLFQNADFWQDYIDRWQNLRSTFFSDANLCATLDTLAAETAEAKVRDDARWKMGYRTVSSGYAFDGTWQGEVNHMRWWLTTRTAFIDSQFIDAPTFSRSNETLDQSILLSLSAPSNTTIYYTLDGSDPRARGGRPSATASVYTGTLVVAPDSVVKARAWNGADWVYKTAPPFDAPWSGISQTVFPRKRSQLQLTEVHYNPAAPAEGSLYSANDFEFIELQNTGTSSIDLRGYELDGGIEFSFAGSAVESLPAGAFVVVVEDLAAFSSLYNTNGMYIAGEYSGKLADSGDNIRLEFYKLQVFDIAYSDARGWPDAADGGGSSLIPLNDRIDEQGCDSLDYPGNWRASTYIGGSPGMADPEPPAGPVINEVIAHTDTGLTPPFDSNDKIELFNPTGSAITLDSHWFLSDDLTNPEIWNIPSGTVIPSGGRVVFDEDDFHPLRTDGFGLNKAGEQVVLSHRPGAGMNRVVDCAVFKGQANGLSWGRYPDGNAFFQTLQPTPGSANQLPDPGIRIGELMYHPLPQAGADMDSVLEYILLTNCSSKTVSFAGETGITNTWRMNGGVEYSFTTGTSMAAHERLWLVPFNPATDTNSKALFCSTYGLNASSARLLGPYSGNLANNGERIALERPQASDDPLLPDDISWIIVDEVTWSDEAPWPESADETGFPLIRTGSAGNDPASWKTLYDTDDDNLPDSWEKTYRTALGDLGAGDFDGDGFCDRDEYLAGTSPTDPNSFLKITRVEKTSGNPFYIRWTSVTGRMYHIYTSSNLFESFLPLAQNLAYPQGSYTDLTYQVGQNNRFYYIKAEPLK
ncbi:MAG: CotH kinase family protein [Kiritimatiellales bacterium]|nr:CotH kinase family protein [Kiritimatiellales bacterium]